MGQYQDKSGQTYCESCVAGYYGPVTAATACVKCDAGFFNPDQVVSLCLEVSWCDSTGLSFWTKVHSNRSKPCVTLSNFVEERKNLKTKTIMSQ